MPQIIDPTKIALPEGEESFDLDLVIANFQKLNDLMPIITTANSATNGTDMDFRQSRFMKIKTGDNIYVVAEFIGNIKSGRSLALPANFNTAAAIDNVIPLGFQPSRTMGMQQGPVISGEARGDNLQAGISGRNLLLRSSGAAVTRTSSSGDLYLNWSTTYWGVA